MAKQRFGQSRLYPAVTIAPSEISASSRSKLSNARDLHLLSIEGRGICGFTALITLKEVCRQYQYSQKLPQPPRPCDVFDLAGGTGTGGIIAIMLFRLGMTVDEAISAYTRLSEHVFSKMPVWAPNKTKASRLKNAIATIIHTSLHVDESRVQEIRMLDDNGPKCFVGASTAKNLSSPTLFRTYTPPRHATYNCTIVEAIRATTAEEPFFPSINIGDANLKEKFVNLGSRINNPVKAVLEEAMSIFPGQSISCVLSIGTGAQGITSFETTSATEFAKVLKKVMKDGEHISDEVAKELSDEEVFYCRLNVDHGLDDIGFEDWERLGDVGTHTRKFLEKYDTTKKVSRLVQVLDRRTVITSTIEETLMVLGRLLDGLISIAPGESCSTVISEFNRIVEPNNRAAEVLNMQTALLRDTVESCIQGKEFMELPEELKENIGQLIKGLKKTFQDSRRQDNPMTHVSRNIHKLLQRFWVQNHIAGNIVLHDILQYIQKDDPMKSSFTRLEQHAINQNLKDLNVAASAAYDSFDVSEKVSCFKGTRVRLLNEIASWVASDDPGLAPIYVLDGVAGIGKSTIAKTVAEHAAGINVLGASFFFSRNDDKRKTAKTFFPTIAYQLAHYEQTFADQINKALLRNPHVVAQIPIKQFATLILEPLKEAFAVVGSPILIVMDALDECERAGDALLKIFADSIRNMPRLKLFITTRPEHHIRIVLDRYRHLKRFHLQDIEKSVVQSDIRLYLDFHLSENQVRDRFAGLQLTWKPARNDTELLIETCGTLFNIASTAVKFIFDTKRSDPAKQLSRLLKDVSRQDFSGSKYTTVMDSLYTQILLSAVPDGDGGDDLDDDWFGHYQIVVGTIVALQRPLPCVVLSTLVDLAPDDVKRALCHLYSLVAPTGQDLTFRIHHKSFPDFVTSPSRCEQRFLIDLTTRHLELGKRCLKILDQLKPNIRNLDFKDRFKENNNVQCDTRNVISQELAYASTHWATHLVNAAKIDAGTEQLLEDFAHKHFLAWLEVLSIIGQVEIAYPSLDKIGKLLDVSKTTAGIMREICRDGCRFIALNNDLIKVAAGQVFTAFAFAPQDTKLFRTYRRAEGINLRVVSGYEKTWKPTISVMTGHEHSVDLVTFSGDGTKLASASRDKSVRLWDGQSGTEITILRGHSDWVTALVFSPDSTKLASASLDGTVRLWDSQTGCEISEIMVLQGHSDLAFSHDGMKVASASNDGIVRLWDGQTGAEITVLRGHSNSVNTVAFSPDGSRVVSASDDGTVRLWGSKIAVLRGHSDSVNSVVFSPDGLRLASASADETVRLWNGQSAAGIAVLQGHSDWVNSVVFSPDGTKLASASHDRTVRLWDGQTGANITVLQGHSDRVTSVVFSLDGTRLASASYDRTVRLWDGRIGTEISVLHGHSDRVYSLAFSPDGTRLASASSDQTVRLWDGQIGAEILAHSEKVNSMVFSLDGTKVAFVLADGKMRLWDIRKGAEITVRGHPDPVDSVIFSPDGTKVASALLPNGAVQLLDGLTGAEIAVLKGHSNKVESMVFSPDGVRLASTSLSGTVLWDGQTGAQITVLRGHWDRWDRVNSMAFSADGTRLASGSGDQTVRLWDGQTGAEIATLKGHSGLVNFVEFSPDGMKLATVSDDSVRLWDGQTGAKIVVLPHLADSIVFSPDGMKLIAFGSGGRTVNLLDAQTGAQIASAAGSTAGFTLDSSILLSMASIRPQKVYKVNCISGRKVGVSLHMPIDSIVDAVQVPGRNVWIIWVNRTHPSLPGLLVVKVGNNDVLHCISLCWFPSDFPVIISLAVSSPSRVAIGCQNGRILLLDFDLSSLR